jgi:hypothetical protein
MELWLSRSFPNVFPRMALFPSMFPREGLVFPSFYRKIKVSDASKISSFPVLRGMLRVAHTPLSVNSQSFNNRCFQELLNFAKSRKVTTRTDLATFFVN